MKREVALGFALVAVAWAGRARATPTPQEACDAARITAWKVYTSCIDAVLADDAKNGIDTLAGSAAFAKCRHAYFRKWTAFQGKASLAGSTCVGSRYRDNGDLTVTDELSGLTWEKKNNTGGIHDRDNSYSWSTGTNKENGTIFTAFLAALNAGVGFGGANGWRLPTSAELQTTVLDFPCAGTFAQSRCLCPSQPCIDPALDPSNTITWSYWTATTYTSLPYAAWVLDLHYTWLSITPKTFTYYVRAVRGGL